MVVVLLVSLKPPNKEYPSKKTGFSNDLGLLLRSRYLRKPRSSKSPSQKVLSEIMGCTTSCLLTGNCAPPTGMMRRRNVLTDGIFAIGSMSLLDLRISAPQCLIQDFPCLHCSRNGMALAAIRRIPPLRDSLRPYLTAIRAGL